MIRDIRVLSAAMLSLALILLAVAQCGGSCPIGDCTRVPPRGRIQWWKTSLGSGGNLIK